MILYGRPIVDYKEGSYSRCIGSPGEEMRPEKPTLVNFL
jgi:hypothetical protein